MSTITTVFRRSLVLLLLACLSCYPWSNSSRIFAQLPQGPDVNRELARSAAARPHLVHMNVELALVNVTVTDPDNNFVAGLEPDNFRVFEDNVEQEVVNFSTEDNPTSVGVVLDLSGSMAGKLDRAKEAVLEFFKTANPQDEFFLVGFNDQAKLLSPFTDDVEDLQSGMLAITAKGSTALLDAVYLGLIQMKDARCSKRALLIISDGGDNHSRYSERDVKRLVREADTQLYSIGLFDSLEYRARTPEELNGPSLLSEITELTGGRSFATENSSDLPGIAAKIGAELRNQYVLAYHPSNKARNSHWRKIKVKMRVPKGLPPMSVYAKTGYYGPHM